MRPRCARRGSGRGRHRHAVWQLRRSRSTAVARAGRSGHALQTARTRVVLASREARYSAASTRGGRHVWCSCSHETSGKHLIVAGASCNNNIKLLCQCDHHTEWRHGNPPPAIPGAEVATAAGEGGGATGHAHGETVRCDQNLIDLGTWLSPRHTRHDIVMGCCIHCCCARLGLSSQSLAVQQRLPGAAAQQQRDVLRRVSTELPTMLSLGDMEAEYRHSGDGNGESRRANILILFTQPSARMPDHAPIVT